MIRKGWFEKLGHGTGINMAQYLICCLSDSFDFLGGQLSSVFLMQGLLEISAGLGYTLGGLLYQVRTHACMHNLRPMQILVPQLGGFKLPFLSVGVLASILVLPCALLVKGDTSEYLTGSSLQSLHHLANVM